MEFLFLKPNGVRQWSQFYKQEKRKEVLLPPCASSFLCFLSSAMALLLTPILLLLQIYTNLIHYAQTWNNHIIYQSKNHRRFSFHSGLYSYPTMTSSTEIICNLDVFFFGIRANPATHRDAFWNPLYGLILLEAMCSYHEKFLFESKLPP